MRNIAVLAPATTRPFELAVFCEVFGIDRSDIGVPAFDFAVVSERPGAAMTSAGGLTLATSDGLDRLAEADLVAVAPTVEPELSVSTDVKDALHAVVNRGGKVMAVCTGTFTLAAAGLLDGHRAVTHWSHTDLLAATYPLVTVEPDAIYVDDDPVFTSAGTVASIDLCLYLICKEHGVTVASTIARRMVMSAHRLGGQSQYVASFAEPRRGEGIDELLDWALRHLHEDLSIDVMARRTFQSRRSFARRFRAATGTTPYAWVVEQRVRRAQQLLEEFPDLTIGEVAARTGFGSATLLRQHFSRKIGCPPTDYRSRFSPRDETVTSG